LLFLVTIAVASFCCGVLMAVVDAIGTNHQFAPLSAGLAVSWLGTLIFGLPSATISGIIVWLRRPGSGAGA
jgi:hypothetical protein